MSAPRRRRAPDSYAAFAALYDGWQRQFHPPFWRYVLERTQPYFAEARSALDLACGTGNWALPLARTGVRVYAVDGSAAMLARLRAKSRGPGQPRRLRASLTRFQLPQPVDLAGCFFDSLNHLDDTAQLAACFRQVSRALNPGGRFVFDLNNETCFRQLWNGHFITHLRPYTLTMRSRYDAALRRAECELVVFVRGPGHRYTRWRSLIREHYFAPAEVRAALRGAGFDQIECEAITPFPEISADPLKTWWRCRRSRDSRPCPSLPPHRAADCQMPIAKCP